jgi:uncharacterized delta-60 repeat protein/uncharacterized repeat protein (TIGR01451 family)
MNLTPQSAAPRSAPACSTPDDHARRGVLRPAREFIILCAAVLFACSAFPDKARAAPGDPDPTFGAGGVVTTAFTDFEDGAAATFIQPDGKIIVVGYLEKPFQFFRSSGVTALGGVIIGPPPNRDFAVARYNPDGSLDERFGDGGKVTTDFFGRVDEARAVALRQDGKIIVAGFATNGGGFRGLAMARYNPDGGLDTSFGVEGKVTDFAALGEAHSMLIQPDGRIVVGAGRLARFTSDGELDQIFSVASPTSNISVQAIAIQPNGKIVGAGVAAVAPGNTAFGLVRYNPDGTFDTTFGFLGKVFTDLTPTADEAHAVAIQPDGKILVGGYATTVYRPASNPSPFVYIPAYVNQDFALVRYHANGLLDATFGSGGAAFTDFFDHYFPPPAGLDISQGDSIASIVLRQDGKIVVGGTAVVWTGIHNINALHVALARYNPDGSADAAFGGDGRVLNKVANYGGASAVALQSDGKIVVAGFAATGHGSDFALLRFLGDVPLPPAAATTPVIFIPGISGSRLNDPASGRELWPGGLFTSQDDLCLDPLNVNCKFGVNPSDVIREITIVPTAIPGVAFTSKVYKPLLDFLRDHGYAEDGAHNLYVFPYDWRKSNVENARLLKGLIAFARGEHQNGKVNIVAHSLGGVLARRYILENPDPELHHVDKLITIGTPFLGAPKAINTLETGQFFEIFGMSSPYPATAGTIKRLVEFFPGAHELLPSDAYYQLGGPAFGEYGWDINGDGVAAGARPSQVYNYAYGQQRSLLNGRHPRSLPSEAGYNLHNAAGQDDWRGAGFGVSYHHLYGIKSHADTIGQVIATLGIRCKDGKCFLGHQFDLKLVRGDGTVPTVSALRVGKGLNYNAEGADLIPFLDTRIIPFLGDSVEHTGLTKNSQVQERILSILSGTDSLTASAAKDGVDSGAAKRAQLGSTPLAVAAEAEPPEEGIQQAYYVKVLGASSAKVADDAGNANFLLGKESPGLLPEVTSYLLAPDSVLAVTPTDRLYTLTLVAGDTPLALDLTRGTDLETVQAVRYLDVNLPAGTPLKLQITPDGVGPLSYDSDGDGIFDSTITPTAVVSGAAAQDAEPPVVAAEEGLREGGRFVHLTAADEGAGVGSLFYSMDGSNFQPYTGDIVINHPGPGVVYAFAQDNVANRSSLYKFDLQAHPDLSLAVSVSPDPVLSGGNITYTVTVTNKGAAPAEGVSVNNSLPTSVSIVSCSATGGAVCAYGTNNNQSVTWARLDAGATAVITLVGRVNCAAANGKNAENFSVVGSQTPDFDRANNTATAVVKISNPPPVILGLSVDKPVLWPPDNKMVDVAVNYTMADNCGVVLTALSVSSNESAGREGDWELLSANKVRLRAKRDGTGQGRTYTITVTSTDSAGGKSTGTVSVSVPHDQSKKAGK